MAWHTGQSYSYMQAMDCCVIDACVFHLHATITFCTHRTTQTGTTRLQQALQQQQGPGQCAMMEHSSKSLKAARRVRAVPDSTAQHSKTSIGQHTKAQNHTLTVCLPCNASWPLDLHGMMYHSTASETNRQENSSLLPCRLSNMGCCRGVVQVALQSPHKWSPLCMLSSNATGTGIDTVMHPVNLCRVATWP